MMKALTVQQPWASLIAHGFKPVEFRKGEPPTWLIGQRIAIHAGKKRISPKELRGLIALCSDARFKATNLQDRDRVLDFLHKVQAGEILLPLGTIVCTAVLCQPLRQEDLARAIGVAEVRDSIRHAHHNFGWPLDNIKLLDPPHTDPINGQLGFWTWNP